MGGMPWPPVEPDGSRGRSRSPRREDTSGEIVTPMNQMRQFQPQRSFAPSNSASQSYPGQEVDPLDAFMNGVTEEVKKVEKKDKKKRKKEGIIETEGTVGDAATTRDQLGNRAYEMYRNRMAKNMDPDGLDDDFASNAPPHGLR
jgi:hypothetical protein